MDVDLELALNEVVAENDFFFYLPRFARHLTTTIQMVLTNKQNRLTLNMLEPSLGVYAVRRLEKIQGNRILDVVLRGYIARH